MKAMILAAGLGTRLRPLTDNLPKALVEINGRTLLEITLERLQSFGIREVIVNVHHHAEKIIEYLKTKNNLGMQIAISREDDLLLDTGGGLKKAAWFFLENNPDNPFLLHNVDVLSTIDLRKMVEAHTEKSALATLAVQERKSSRQLLFGENGLLCGRRKGTGSPDEIVRPSTTLQPLAFSGIHVISPRLLKLITEDGVFSIIDTHLRLAGSGEKISAFRADEYYWRDLGRPEDLVQASNDLRQKAFL
ncbi:MAG TPA: nucleotidyltransferase family protein [Candidatus Sulfotelmatobacter sp.]|jgi:mannose-1-phosphate guanylyltransferase|nr:nucleotidyltransferase family protein [Candidatus Sulfotelmatobacter sp.]